MDIARITRGLGYGFVPGTELSSLREWRMLQYGKPADNFNLPDSSSIWNDLHAPYDHNDQMAKEAYEKHKHSIIINEISVLLSNAITTQYDFHEHLSWFWYNFFTVSNRQNDTGPLIGSYIREAIRPNVFGKFHEMLLAVIQHPAMLRYLDNNVSVGPDSKSGVDAHSKGKSRGLNENLGRECLELYTITPQSGYTQEDVTNFSKILTGWGIDKNGKFKFKDAEHEPGEYSILNQTFINGERGGLDAILWLGTHPMTYQHIATRLLQHYVDDKPSKKDIAVLTAALQKHEGSLYDVYDSLISIKIRSGFKKYPNPLDTAISVCRALGLQSEQIDVDSPLYNKTPAKHIQNYLYRNGMPLWNAPMPNGWSDDSKTWMTPAGVVSTIDWIYEMAGLPGIIELPMIKNTVSNSMPENLQMAVDGAQSVKDAICVLLSSSEFLMR